MRSTDASQVWADKWREEVRLGIVPYYMFMARDTGAQAFFDVPLVRAQRLYADAMRNTSGLCRTARGPSMSCTPGKVEVVGVQEIMGQEAFVLRFLQCRDESWIGAPHAARAQRAHANARTGRAGTPRTHRVPPPCKLRVVTSYDHPRHCSLTLARAAHARSMVLTIVLGVCVCRQGVLRQVRLEGRLVRRPRAARRHAASVGGPTRGSNSPSPPPLSRPHHALTIPGPRSLW
jgi:hypothetical protein